MKNQKNQGLNFISGYDAITSSDNKANGEINDCVVRAVMNAFDVSYNRAHNWVERKFGRRRGEGTFMCSYLFEKMGKSRIVLNGRRIYFEGVHPKVGFNKWLDGSEGDHPKTMRNPKYKNAKRLSGGFTVGEFIRQHQVGSYIILVSGHALAVKDGVMYDNWSSWKFKTKGEDKRPAEYVFKIK